MKIFISWSGGPSKQVAELFEEWLQLVLQHCDPWISTKGIESGSQWFTEIGDQLATANIGIICLTKANRDKPWLLFEAGALLKGLTDGRVCPFLIDLPEQEISPPLSHLNVTLPERDSVFKLVQTINNHLAKPLPGPVLSATFDMFWPKFQERFTAIRATIVEDSSIPVRNINDILGEVLENLRYSPSIGQKMGEL